MQSVANIFGGEAKVKIMRLFIFNPENVYDTDSVAAHTQEKRTIVARELRNLVKAELLRKKTKGFVLNQNYVYLKPIEHFLVDASPITDKEIVKKIARAGSIKLVLTSGVFIHDPEARVDLLVVGDHIKKGVLIQAISSIEAELGKEIRYAAFETADFQYRYGLYDKLIRDILDFNHNKILNKLGI
jgi:predicted transcriptional regulator